MTPLWIFLAALAAYLVFCFVRHARTPIMRDWRIVHHSPRAYHVERTGYISPVIPFGWGFQTVLNDFEPKEFSHQSDAEKYVTLKMDAERALYHRTNPPDGFPVVVKTWTVT